jgi:predicted transcriptional regulator
MTARTALKATSTALALAFAAAPMTALTAQTATAQQDAAYSADELDIFTEALLRVADVRQKYTARMQAAETEERQAALVEEANAEIVTVIEETDGITLERYTVIAKAANEDQSLNQRIVKRVQAMTEQGQ